MPSPPTPPPVPPTPLSERTFADRLQRGRAMQAATAIFAPAFAPADASLVPPAFDTFLDGLETLNTTVSTRLGSYTTAVNERNDMVKDIKARALRVLSYVDSNPVWKNAVRSVKALVDKLRGNDARKPKPPAAGETPGSPAAKARNKGEQSYGDIAANLERLIAVLGTISGYSPPATEITVASLATLSGNYSSKNAAMATLLSQTGLAQRDRGAAYDGDDGLRAKMKAIKNAVRSQYGADSAEYDAVKGMKL